MYSVEEIFKKPQVFKFLKYFISHTVNEINNEYNMSFIKFVFNAEDIDLISDKLDLDSDNIRRGINILKRNIREYNANRNEDINYIKVNDTYKFFSLLNRIYEQVKNEKKASANDLIRSIWLRMGVNDLEDVNGFLKQQLDFLYGDRLFNNTYQVFEKDNNYKLVYDDSENEDCFETNNHLELSFINRDYKQGLEKEKYSLPVVHYAISYESEGPVCYIYGIQSLDNQRKDDSVKDYIKEYKKPLRNSKVSPEFVFTLKKFIDIIESYGITTIKVPLLQVFNYQYHEYLSKAIDRDYADYTEEEREKYEEMDKNGDLTSSVLCYLFTKKSYERFVDKEDVISKNKTERLIDTFMIMEEKYHNVEFLNEPFIEGDTLLVKVKKDEKVLRKAM